MVRITDRGPGIPVSEQEAVFQPFYRLDQSRNVATGGTGLGLVIARQLAEANGWKVELRAREGGASGAILTVPKRSDELPAPEAEERPETETGGVQPA